MKIAIITDGNTTAYGFILANYLYQEIQKIKEDVKRIIIDERNFDVWVSTFLDLKLDTIITFDLAGFNHYNQKKEIIYNFLYCKNIHVLTREPWYYPDELLIRVNFNTVFIVEGEKDADYLNRYYENIPQTNMILETEEYVHMNHLIFNDKDLFLIDYEPLAEIKKGILELNGGFSTMAFQILNNWEIKSNPYLPDEIIRYLKRINCSYKDKELIELSVLMKDIPYYYKIIRLLKYLDSSIANNKSITICGKGWETLDTKYKEYPIDFLNRYEDLRGEFLVSQSLIQSIMNCMRCG